MQTSERPEFVLLIAAMASTFSKEASEAILEGYWMGLEDLPITAVKRAVAIGMRQLKFMPAVAELRELAGQLTPQDRAVKAWAVVMDQIGKTDYYDSVVFDDPITTAAIRNIWKNWIVFCDVLEREDEKWMRKDFERVYCSLMRFGVTAEDARYLLGWTEQQAVLTGHKAPAPVVITCGLPDVPIIGRRVIHSLPKAEVKLLESIGKMP